jgi:pimeloyl-ACP methyl ester carboxylesterase
LATVTRAPNEFRLIRAGSDDQRVQLAADVDAGLDPAIVALHGLAGHRGEWEGTARWLREGGFRVIAYDARGHGNSTRRPRDVSRAANVADAAAVLRAVGDGPQLVIGQSLGGHTAMLLAAEHPDLVSAVVMLDAGPSEAEPSDAIATWLSSWPIPFATRDDAIAFFRGGAVGSAWAAGLTEDAGGGFIPAFDADVIVATITEHSGRPYWDQWDTIRCPILVVLAGNGFIDAAEEREMQRRQPGATIVRIPDVGHDLHLEAPKAVRDVVLRWLANRSRGPADMNLDSRLR